MEELWTETPVQRFWRRLIRDRALEFMHEPKFLTHLRYHNAGAVDYQKKFGEVWAEHGTNIYKLLAETHGENWDAEDEEKHAGGPKKEAAILQRENDDVVTAREKGPCERQHQFQGKPETSLGIVEEAKGGREARQSPEESAAQEDERRRRREDFYRRAGGT